MKRVKVSGRGREEGEGEKGNERVRVLLESELLLGKFCELDSDLMTA